jgi:hypothetical protein
MVSGDTINGDRCLSVKSRFDEYSAAIECAVTEFMREKFPVFLKKWVGRD